MAQWKSSWRQFSSQSTYHNQDNHQKHQLNRTKQGLVASCHNTDPALSVHTRSGTQQASRCQNNPIPFFMFNCFQFGRSANAFRSILNTSWTWNKSNGSIAVHQYKNECNIKEWITLEALRQSIHPTRHVLPVPPSGESVRTNVR